MGTTKKDHLQGSLDLLVLRTLASYREPLHGYAITDHIHRLSKDALRVEEGSLYPALHRMDEAGWIRSEWGVSENNRRARYLRHFSSRPPKARAARTGMGRPYQGGEARAEAGLTCATTICTRRCSFTSTCGPSAM